VEQAYKDRLKRNKLRRQSQRAAAFAASTRVQTVVAAAVHRSNKPIRKELEEANRRSNKHYRKLNRVQAAATRHHRNLLATETALKNLKRKLQATETELNSLKKKGVDRLVAMVEAQKKHLNELTQEKAKAERKQAQAERARAADAASHEHETQALREKLLQAELRWGWALTNSTRTEREELLRKGATRPRRGSDRCGPHGRQ